MSKLVTAAAFVALLVSLSSCGADEAEPPEALGTGRYQTEIKDFAPSCPSTIDDDTAFVDEVVSLRLGEGAGHGADAIPEIVLGQPEGRGAVSGGLDVVSLGVDGEIIVRLGADAVDCDGPDLIVFENAFSFGGSTFYELGEVSVSFDGQRWATFGCDPDGEYPFPGCAGVAIVSANGSAGVDPRDPEVAGGDAFDLADVGLERARFVRIRDLGVNNGPSTGQVQGFDLDAIAIVRGHGEPFGYRPQGDSPGD